jgi:hypothetical protein
MLKQKHVRCTSVSILNDTKRAMTAAAASWSKPATSSYNTNKLAKVQIPLCSFKRRGKHNKGIGNQARLLENFIISAKQNIACKKVLKTQHYNQIKGHLPQHYQCQRPIFWILWLILISSDPHCADSWMWHPQISQTNSSKTELATYICIGERKPTIFLLG